MTAPNPPQPVQETGLEHPAVAAVVAALAAYFASREAIAATTLPPRILALLVEIGIPLAIARHAGMLAQSVTMAGRHRVGTLPATPSSSLPRRVAASEPEMRARYVLNAARRLAAAAKAGRYRDALQAERRYLAAHLLAGRGRRAAARRLEDVLDGNPRRQLVWVTHLHDGTCSVCRGLHGVVFTVARLPDGHMPGAVHPNCRCSCRPADSTS